MLRLTTLIVLAFTLAFAHVQAAGSAIATKHRQSSKSSKAVGERAAKYARPWLGVPYVWGGSSPRTGFDCSGFVSFVWNRFGVSLPHSSYAQFDRGRRISRRWLRPGDLVFFHGVGHVGLYIGHNRFVHAPHRGAVVSVDSMSGWYSHAFDGARRIR